MPVRPLIGLPGSRPSSRGAGSGQSSAGGRYERADLAAISSSTFATACSTRSTIRTPMSPSSASGSSGSFDMATLTWTLAPTSAFAHSVARELQRLGGGHLHAFEPTPGLSRSADEGLTRESHRQPDADPSRVRRGVRNAHNAEDPDGTIRALVIGLPCAGAAPLARA
jgi:hypothetical protein